MCRIAQLVGDEQRDDLERAIATVDIIAEEEIAGVGRRIAAAVETASNSSNWPWMSPQTLIGALTSMNGGSRMSSSRPPQVGER